MRVKIVERQFENSYGDGYKYYIVVFYNKLLWWNVDKRYLSGYKHSKYLRYREWQACKFETLNEAKEACLLFIRQEERAERIFMRFKKEVEHSA